MGEHHKDAIDALQDGGGLRARSYHVPFPDDEPRRRVRFAKLPHNALPSPEAKRLPRQTPTKSVANNEKREGSYSPASSSVSSAVQNIRRQHIKRKVTHRPPSISQADAKLRGLASAYLPRATLLDQWIATRSPRPRRYDNLNDAGSQPPRGLIDTQDDYALYLYLASKYGALDGLLYCSAPRPGHTYRCLVSTSARRLQRWSRRRVCALRQFWVAHLAQATASFALDEGLTAISHSYHHEQTAMAHFQRVCRLRAIKVLRRWRDYAVQMEVVRWRFAAAIDRDIHARFLRWRERTAAVKQFKRQLKTVARRKAMAYAMDQWQQWKERHEKMRLHLSKRWMKTQCECLATWALYARESRASRCIQRSWRIHWWRQARVKAGALIAAVAKGCLGRNRVRELRSKIEVGYVVITLVEKLVWTNYHDEVVKIRTRLLASEIARVVREKQFVLEAEQAAEALVDRELSAVVRNAMHQQLQATMQTVKETHASGNSKTLKSHELLRSLAKRQLAEDQRSKAREEALAAFRCADPINRPLERCLVCVTQVEGESPLACFRADRHKCISAESISSDPEGVREYLDLLVEEERAHVQASDGRLGMEPGQLHAYIATRWPKNA